MPELKIKFDRHGLGDVVHFAHALQLYRGRGWDVTVQIEANKRFAWQVAGVNIVQGGDLPDHPYVYPAGFEDLGSPDHLNNKVAFGLRHSVMPRLVKIGLTPEQAWDELCQVRLSARDLISAEITAEADRFLEGLPRPIVCFHSRGTNWHERKSIPTEIAFETVLRLLEVTGGSVVILDWDARAPMVADPRCRGIVPGWGKITIDRLCALYQKSDLMIGVDSGPFHVAQMTDIKAVGVFRTLHPPRVCLPNPRAVHLVSGRYQGHWDARRDRWQFASYAGDEPTAEDIVAAAQLQLQSPGPVRLQESRSRFAGRYVYRRVGYDERSIELLLDGTIAEGRGDCEQRWSVSTVDGLPAIAIHGKHGIICTCVRDPARNNIYYGRWMKFERMPIEIEADLQAIKKGYQVHTPIEISEQPDLVRIHSQSESILGEYFFEQIGFYEFPIKLLPNGTAESRDFFAWRINGSLLRLVGGNSFRDLQLQEDGCWRGENCEMIPASRQPFRSFGDVTAVEYQPHMYSYMTLEEFKEHCFHFARQLPPVKAIAGVPRSGLVAASLMALELNCPLIPLESLLQGQIPALPIPRRGRGARYRKDGLILVVDDSASSGRVLRRLRSQLPPDVKTATVFRNPSLQDGPDFFFREQPQDVHFSFEWALFHDDNCEFTLSDMDGVLCEDWHGGLETDNLAAYEYFLSNAKPRRIPSYPLLGIVTNRLEQYREVTEDWLARHGVKYGELIMSPYASIEARDGAGDAASRKANVYLDRPQARLFVESCRAQSRRINEITSRPVLCTDTNRLLP